MIEQQSKDYARNEYDPTEQSGGSSVWILILLGVIFLPAVLVSLAYAALLRYGRLRFSVILIIAAIIDGIAIFSLKASNAFAEIGDVFRNISTIGENWQTLIVPLLLINLIIGSIIGLSYCVWAVRQMVVNPWKLSVPGSWMYQFKYRKTPWQVLRRKKNAKKLKEGALNSKGKAALGIDEDSGDDNVVYRYDGEAIKHTLITGLPGSGKSISMMSMMKSDIEEGKSVVAIDFKRDPELASKLATWAKENGRNFYHFVNGEAQLYDIANSPGQAFYNPLASGTPTSKADMLLSMREYDTASAVYKAAMTQVLQVVFNMEYYVTLYKRRQNIPTIDWESGGFYTLVSIFTGNNLNELADQCVGTPIQDEAIALAQAISGRTQESHAADELRGQLRTITASEYGPWMRLNRSGRNIDLFELTKEPGNVVLFSLNSDSEPEFAKYMGAIILSDLTSVSAKRRNEDLHNQVHVYVDEFQIVNPDSIKGLLEKSRASSMGITLAQQSLEQIISSSSTNGEAYLGSVLDTCGNFIIHFGATEPSAIRMSEILGKDDFETYSASVKNESFFGRLNWANRRNQRVMMGTEERWIYEPLRFMQLDSPSPKNGFKSTAIIINKTSMDKKFKGEPGAKARKVWMIPDNRVLEKYYTRDTSKKFVAPEVKDTPLDNAIKRLEDKAPENPGFNTSFSSLSREHSVKSPSRPPRAPDIFVETLEDPKDPSLTTPPAKPISRPSPPAKPSEPALQKQNQMSQRSEKRPAPNFNNFGTKRNSTKSSRQNQPTKRPPISSFEKVYSDITDNEELPSIE